MLMPDGLLDSLDDDSGRLEFCDGHAGESEAGDWSRRWTAVATAANLDLFAEFHPRLASLTAYSPFRDSHSFRNLPGHRRRGVI